MLVTAAHMTSPYHLADAALLIIKRVGRMVAVLILDVALAK